ncbi:hypothetical protein [Minwuia sp.]|uniref:hypothetical protein n=1 Tax=Minwuia sp. TaxID=2493630 RepID=UPI003A9259AC
MFGALLVAISVSVLSISLYGAYSWPIVGFTAACKRYKPHADTFQSDLLFINGKLTSEFWDLAHKKLSPWPSMSIADRENVRLTPDSISTTLAERYNYLSGMKKFEDDREEWFYNISKSVSEEIYRHRVEENIINSRTRSQFMIFRERWNMMMPMEPDECGFMEELIMQGGRFASE